MADRGEQRLRPGGPSYTRVENREEDKEAEAAVNRINFTGV